VPWLLLAVLLVLVVAGSVAVLALALLATWRTAKRLTAELGRAASVTADPALQAQLTALGSRSAPARRAPAGPAAALRGDGAALAARVGARR
jgi:hypothetical protein